MSGSPYGQNVRSLYLQRPRPAIPHRQRSNSLPPNFSIVSSTEAGMMFSAAERATARRNKMHSIDYSPSVESDAFFDFSDFPQPPAPNTNWQKPSPLRQATTIRASLNKPLPLLPEPEDQAQTVLEFRPFTPPMVRPAPTEISIPPSLLSKLPVSPLSPKRHVTSPSLKSYADGLLQFTHSRLISTIPDVTVSSPQEEEPQYNERVSLEWVSSLRPSLTSKFSDWSATNESPFPSPMAGLNLDASLMSPDSFFGEPLKIQTGYFPSSNAGISIASSETYEHQDFMPHTPEHTSGEDMEISYFTNFDKFLDAETWPVHDQGDQSPLDSVVIDLSALENCPPTPSEQILESIGSNNAFTRQHRRQSTAATVIRRAASSAPLLSAGMPPCTGPSPAVSPSVHVAEVAVRVPGWLIGAMG